MADDGEAQLKRARIAVTTLFALNGAGFASLFARLPELRALPEAQ